VLVLHSNKKFISKKITLNMKFTANNFIKAAFLVGVASVTMVSCKKDFLTVAPKGELTEEVLGSKKGVEGLLIGSYGMLSGRWAWYGGSSNWVHGSVLGGDANKGTNSGDQAIVNPLMRFETTPSNGAVADKWGNSFEGVARANAVLKVLAASTDLTISATDKERIAGEARFLRGHYYFELKKNFNNVPYFDETLPSSDIVKVPNTNDIWAQIEADFKYGYEKLPETSGALGRANKWAAGAYYAKTLLFQKKYAEAKAVFTDVITNGKTTKGDRYALNANFADAFNAEFDNSAESVFAIQAAANSGTASNANYDFVLNFPYNTGSNGPGNCCGFFQPSFDMANSYRTASGLPLLDGTYNDAANALKTDMGVLSADAFTPDAGPVDPRLDHTVGRRGIPYLDWQDHPGNDWIREQSYAGPFSPKKFIYYKRHEATLTDGSGWTRGYAAMNYNIIRYSDVLLMAAECEVEAGDLDVARGYVNKVRARAANAGGFVKRADGTPAANYVISEYTDSWVGKQDAARAATRFERKLELSGEGHRFYDLVRWGVAATDLNKYFAYEGSKLPIAVGGASFTAGKNEYYPIPQTQIDRQGADVLKQNPGY
jgi:starch-binding outer membrane protein, SusD/RagB family